jgi:hypothetical protein
MGNEGRIVFDNFHGGLPERYPLDKENPFFIPATLGMRLSLNLASTPECGKRIDLSLIYNPTDDPMRKPDFPGFPASFRPSVPGRLHEESNGYVLYDQFGILHHFILAENAKDVYYDPEGGYLLLTCQDDSGHILEYPDGMRLVFDQTGRLVAYDGLNITYLEDGRIDRISYLDGGDTSIRFTYSADRGMLSAVDVYSLGKRTDTLSLLYNERRLPSEVVQESTSSSNQRTLLVLYYDSDGLLSECQYPSSSKRQHFVYGLTADRRTCLRRYEVTHGGKSIGGFEVVKAEDIGECRKVSVKNAKGITTTYMVSADGKVCSAFEDTDGTLRSLCHLWGYSFDLNGNSTETIDSKQAVATDSEIRVDVPTEYRGRAVRIIGYIKIKAPASGQDPCQ